MIKILTISLKVFIFTLNANESTSCVNLINLYNKANYTETILGQKGYEKQIKKYSIKEKEFIFMELLDSIDSVKFKFIDKKCYQLYFILKEKKFSVKQKKLLSFKKKVFSKYKNKIRRQKQIIKTVDGCQKFASKYFRSFLNINRDKFKKNSVSKRQYKKCLNIQLKKRR